MMFLCLGSCKLSSSLISCSAFVSATAMNDKAKRKSYRTWKGACPIVVHVERHESKHGNIITYVPAGVYAWVFVLLKH